MIFNKEELVLSLQEKANEKIEMLRHSMAQSLFESINEESFFVFDKKAEEVVGGPFASKTNASAFVKEMDSKDLVIMTEKALEKKMGLKTEEKISEETKKMKDMDSVLNWFATANYLNQEFDFDSKTGVLKMNGKAVATKGADGSFSIDVTACGKARLKESANYSEDDVIKLAKQICKETVASLKKGGLKTTVANYWDRYEHELIDDAREILSRDMKD